MPVNEQVTDSITHINIKTVGEIPAMALGNFLLSTSQALGIVIHKATAAQQQAQIMMQVVTVQGVNALMAIGRSILGRSAKGIIEKEA